MCGICGIASSDVRRTPLDPDTLRAMTDVITHRGPDEEGWHRSPGVALGVRRLSVIDLSGSHQPLSNEDGSVIAVYNGEIYNYRELRRELTSRGHRLGTDGDGETIVHLYEEFGDDFASHLRGMFAIAVWDAKRRRLVLTRDRMGVKPLYVADTPAGIAFASEVKSLIAGGLVVPELDRLAAESLLGWGYVPGPATVFRGVTKLAPATTLVWHAGERVDEREYWDPRRAQVTAAGDWEGDQRRLLELLRSAVTARMISDVPLGVMLSGGLDSSLIAALMAEAAAGPVKTFSIGFAEDMAANELGDARRVARRLGTDHHELLTSAVDHPTLLDEALWHMEEPIADLSHLGFLALSRLARQSVTVALSGQGADELLGGYRKHQIAWLADLAGRSPAAFRRVGEAVRDLAPRGSTLERGLTAVMTSDPVERALAMSRIMQADQRRLLLAGGALDPRGEHELGAAIDRRLRGTSRSSALSDVLFLDSRLALVDSMLLYFDKMSMAASLEVRVPFMDANLVAFCNGLPDSRRIWLWRRKELLRRASSGLVDAQTIRKKKRAFFRGAIGAWLRVHRDTLFPDVLLDPSALARGLYREDAVRALLARAGRGNLRVDQALLSLLVLEKWMRLFVDQGGLAAPVSGTQDGSAKSPRARLRIAR